MNLVLDCREAALIAQCRALLDAGAYDSTNVVLEVRSLPLGDILMEEKNKKKEEDKTEDDDDEKVVVDGESTATATASTTLLIERKAVADLLASITDGRYAEQSFRLQHHPCIPPHNIMYLLEGSLASLGAASRQKCYSALASCQYFKGFSICRTESLADTAHYLVATVAKLSREMIRGGKRCFSTVATAATTNDDPSALSTNMSYASVVHTVKKNNLSSANIGAVFLAQIPGFSAASAECVMAAVPNRSIHGLLCHLESSEGRAQLRALTFGGRRLGEAAVAKLCAFLRPDLAEAVAGDDTKQHKKKKPKPKEAASSSATTTTTTTGKKRSNAADATTATTNKKPKKRTKSSSAAASSLFVSSFPDDEE